MNIANEVVYPRDNYLLHDCSRTENILRKENVHSDEDYEKRLSILKKEIKINPQLNEEEKISVKKIIVNYNDIFFVEVDKLSCADVIRQSINLSTDKPIFVKQYPLPQIYRQEVDKQVSKMLKRQ